MCVCVCEHLRMYNVYVCVSVCAVVCTCVCLVLGGGVRRGGEEGKAGGEGEDPRRRDRCMGRR